MRGRLRHGWRQAVLVVAGASVLGVLGGSPVAAGTNGPGTTGPRVVLDRLQVLPGEPVVITLVDFDADFVNVTLCGNLATRGAADCNMTAGVSKEIEDGRGRLLQLFAHPPPMPCPCVIWASSPSGDQFALAPIELIGHPVGPIVGVEDGPLIEVEVRAERAPAGVVASLRSALGGPTRYGVTVSVRNTTTETVSNVLLDGSASRRFDDDAAVLDLDIPGSIEPGQTWTQELEAEVSAPAIGAYTFEIIASGAGPTVIAQDQTGHVPALLVVLLVVLAADIVVLWWRFSGRRRREREEHETERLGLDAGDWDDEWAEQAERELSRR